ncbi:hypothetical protein QT231_13400 [Halomonas sp. SpR1]|uniref:hypothetical protein n=1 Tax=Halomonas sp. SpR1 TaxID=3050462 RepID=UPI0027E3E080|nr:hypothetical protein [Halomonas sp. SpR1]MDQ7733702.1 hypothetical protein [Halomonas sp. SpR1]
MAMESIAINKPKQRSIGSTGCYIATYGIDKVENSQAPKRGNASAPKECMKQISALLALFSIRRQNIICKNKNSSTKSVTALGNVQ